MHFYYIFGLLLIFLLSKSHSMPPNPTQNDEYLYLDEDYDYYSGEDEENNDKMITTTIETTLVNININNSSTIQTTTITSIDLDDDVLIELLKPEPKCPVKCVCTDEYKFVDCSNRNLTKVPNDIPETVIQIDLSYNLIDQIDDEIFINCSNLRNILLSNNKISDLRKEAFTGLIKLDHIDLASNSISKIDPNTFMEIIEFKKLSLNNNPIKVNENTAILNQPNLQELSLKNCNLIDLNNETFENLTGLLSLNMENNNFDKKINTEAFKPLKKLAKLKVPELERNIVSELCKILTSIDVISLETFDISCFELESGSSFDESIIVTTPETMKPITTSKENNQERNIHFRTRTNIMTDNNSNNRDIIVADVTPSKPNLSNNQTQSSDTGNMTNFSDKNLKTNSSIEQHSYNEKDIDDKTYQVEIASNTINHILIGIIILAVVGLMIGLVCRRDICGIKTKFCRTRRPPPTDQVRPAEEIPLNKV